MVIFDYIYFRTAKYYFKKDGSAAPRAIAIVSVIQSLMIGALLFVLDRQLSGIEIPKEIAKYVGILIAGLVLLLNYIRYKGKYFRYRERWLNKSTDYKLKGYLVVIAILIPFLLLLLMTDNPFFNKLF